MLKSLIAFSLRYASLVVIAAVLVTGYAAWRLPEMSVDVFPELNAPTVVIMAEAGEIETEKPAPAVEGEEPASGASKCPFSGALADMGIDITKMSKEEAMGKMGDMSKIFPDDSNS